jgi:transcriptional regulator with XRE-family HTH domain
MSRPRTIEPTVDFDRDVETETLAAQLTDLIAKVMVECGVSKAELARRLGVSAPHVTQTLSGERNMTIKTLAEALYVMGHRVEATAVPIGGASTGSDSVTHDVSSSPWKGLKDLVTETRRESQGSRTWLPMLAPRSAADASECFELDRLPKLELVCVSA